MSGDPDVRGFYAALGIELPAWAGANVAVRCFADPSAHEHDDRTPSCSVSTEHGAWMCWSCGARGGAYDAALAFGHTPASAIELLVEHGLTERRGAEATTTSRSQRSVGPATRRPVAPPVPIQRRSLAATDDDVRRWQEALFAEQRRGWRQALMARRLWSEEAMRELELGFDGARITFPIRSDAGHLRGVLRYRPGAEPKVRALGGSRLGLIPYPGGERCPGGRVLLVEGVGDLVACRSRGWPAVCVPGDRAWKQSWAKLLRGCNVTILMDCDAAGRGAAERIARDLEGVCVHRVVDLDPGRNDGFDLTDWLRVAQREQRGLQRFGEGRRTTCTPCSSSKLTITR